MKDLSSVKNSLVILQIEARKYVFVTILMRVPEYALSGAYYLLKLGNIEKMKNFHRNINPFHKLRYNYIKYADQKILSNFNARFLRGDRYIFKDIIFPKVKASAMYHMYNDVLKVYVEHNDNYDYKFVDKLDKYLPEGVYCYFNSDKNIDITIHKDDVVIDAGAWAGDFSIYAAKKGAKVYAFEPAPSTVKLLEKTINYNNAGNSITIVQSGLGNTEQVLFMQEDPESGGNTVSNAGTEIKITTVDNFVKNNNIKKLDFIKADIEGYERIMLEGAQETLKTLQPTLSICTYHLPDDPEVLENLILQANPKYKVMQRKMKLFAYVEK